MIRVLVVVTAGVCVAWLSGCGGEQEGVWRVETVEQLHLAVEGCEPGDEIVIDPGRYRLRRTLQVNQPHVVIRGRTGKPEQVVLHGAGMNSPEWPHVAFRLADDGIELRDLTISDFWQYGVVCSGREPARVLPDRLVLSNLRIRNCGARHIKAVYSRDESVGVLIEKVHCTQTEKYLRRPGHPVDSNNYIGGIDCMKTRDWIIRDCRFENIRGATGGGRGAIFMWIGSVNPLIERNVIVNCGAAICLGNGHNPDGIYQVSGGIVRNNFVYHPGGWRAVELGFVRNVHFVHNTVYAANPESRTIDIYDRQAIPTKGLVLRGNLIRGRFSDRTRARKVDTTGNLADPAIPPEWFQDAPSGRLFLTGKAKEAIDRVPLLPEAPEDILGRRRPAGQRADCGAHEKP